MRNFFNPMPMMPFPPLAPPPPEHHHHDSGEPLVGEIVNGKVFPYGCVMDEVYEADKQEIRNAIGRLAETIDVLENEISKIEISTIEAEINSVRSDMNESKIIIEDVQATLSEIKTDVENAKSEAITIKSDVSNIKEDIINLKREISEIASIKSTLTAMQQKIEELEQRPSGAGGTDVVIQETEPENSCIWIQPIYTPSVLTAMLNLSENAENSEFIVGIGGDDYGVENIVHTDELTVGKYSFEITR